MSQQGRLRRFDKVTGQRKDIQPVHPDGLPLRFSWNAAIAVDPADSTTIFFGSQLVHRSSDAGDTWDIISPDLTTNDPDKQRQGESGGITRDATGAENHTTILTIAPSPVEQGVVWVGTDDGNVQLTRDGGATWTNLVDRIRGVPANTWVPHIEASKFSGGEAFVVFDDHRRGNWTSYLYRTSDYGRTWQSIVTDELRGFLHVVEQDPEVPALLFAGTEFGMYLSLNGGAGWHRWTHGRGAFVLDDIRPLRALARTPALVDAPLHLFDVPPATLHAVAEAVGYRSTGHAMFSGVNRPFGALLSYWTTGAAEREVTIEALDPDGEVVWTQVDTASRGLNRIAWNLERDGFERPSSTGSTVAAGPAVLPGRYLLLLTSGTDTVGGSLDVLPDPRLDVPRADRERKYAALLRVGRWMEVSAQAVDRLRRTRDGVAAVQDALEGRTDSATSHVQQSAATLREALDSVTARFVAPAGAVTPRDQPPVVARLQRAYASLESSWDAPTQAQRMSMEQASAALEDAVEDANRVLQEDVAAFRDRVARLGIDLLPPDASLRIERP
jgi:hypothetical protein